MDVRGRPRVPSRAWLKGGLPAGAKGAALLEAPTSCAPSVFLTL